MAKWLSTDVRRKYDNLGADRCAIVEIDHVVIDHWNAAGGNVAPELPRLVRVVDLKREKGWTWKYICDQIGGMSPVLITGAILGQMKLTKPQAAKAAELFSLSKLGAVADQRDADARHGNADAADRSADLPLLRNGPSLMARRWKALIEEEFGDGIMSAIDFEMDISRQADPKGDRVKIGMTGKFLPYKYYGATGKAPWPWGLKEECGPPGVAKTQTELTEALRASCEAQKKARHDLHRGRAQSRTRRAISPGRHEETRCGVRHKARGHASATRCLVEL